MKKSILMLILVLSFLAIIPYVSGAILIGQPKPVYNVGDSISIDITLNPSSNTNDFLNVQVVCSNESVEIYKNSFSLSAGQQQVVQVSAFLGRSLIGDLSGESCNLLSKYGSDIVESQKFELSNSIVADIETTGSKVKPGESLVIFGTANKKSGGIVQGFATAEILDLGIIASGSVISGEFSINLTLSENVPAGKYTLVVRIWEEDNTGTLTNELFSNETDIEILQILKSLEISIDEQTAIPGEPFVYRVNAFDQSGSVYDEEFSVSVYEPGDFIFFEGVVKSGSELQIDLENTAVPGYWKIEIISGDKTVRKLFYVEEVEKIQTSLINDTLVIVNIGNVKFEGPLEISIGSANEIKQLSLEVGESKKYRLVAPDGNYLISVNDGNENIPLGDVALTGRAIGVRELNEGLGESLRNPWTWALGILLLGLLVAYVIVKKANKSGKLTFATVKEKLKRKTEKSQNKQLASEGMMYGKREPAAVIAFKTYDILDEFSIQAVEGALLVAKSSGAKMYEDGEFKIALFSESLTKEKDNDFLAAKVAKRIEDHLREHNRKSAKQIRFGLGVSEGTIISELKGREFRFTTVENIIGKAKATAKISEAEALLSEGIHGKLAGRVDSTKIPGNMAWKITKIRDHAKHSGFIERFKQRYKHDDKSIHKDNKQDNKESKK